MTLRPLLSRCALPLAAVLAAAGCSAARPVAAARQAAHASAPKPRVVEESASGTLVRMKPSTAAGFKIVRARSVEIAHRFSAPGSVASDVSRTVTVYSLANGFAVQVPVELGEKVTQGQLLAVVNSPDLAKAISVYQTAEAEETLDDKELAREQKLFQHGAAPRAAVETAQFADQHARIEITAAQSQIRLLGGNPASPSALVKVRAPIGGTIIKQNISRGEAVENAYLFRIADLSRVWVLCSIYENELARVRVGDEARLQLAAYPNLKLHGRIANIAGILNPATRTATVRVVLSNPRGLLMPGMFATAQFSSRRPSLHILVPVTALFELHNRDWLFRPTAPGVFRRVPVTAGTVDTPGWETVTRGIRAGQPVVANAMAFAAAVSAQSQ